MSTEALSPERWQQVKSIFLAAVELDTAKRREYLTSSCGADEELLNVVEQMIRADREQQDLLENPFITPEASSWVGKRVGVYRILSELGHGGMGSVFLAQREGEFDQQVAIKIVRRGLDTDEMLRRFRIERQILAHLDHPNIARLLDGGSTDDGLPYFVMEHVPGVAIDKYCLDHDLGIEDRIKLFRQVCSAVSYAHQHLAVHRDIKPSNILVSENGSPKLLDFGIAKLLDTDLDNARTATVFQMMTPEYASPEQVSGNENVTTASDVYSLGVVLYELLTGRSPYLIGSRRRDELARVICETEPERPSKVSARTGVVQTQQDSRQLSRNSKLLRGDLDNILLMALRKDPARRYSSVEQFSEDLRRYLEGLPVVARADTFSYRASKFIARNRAASVGTMLVVVSLIAGIGATWYQAKIARQERALAQRRFNEVRQLANSVVFKYHDAIEPLPGSTKVREMLVKDALEYLDKLSQESADDRSLQRELALAYLKVGDVQGKVYAANLGNTAAAAESYRKAINLLESLAVESGDVQAQIDLRNAYHTLALTMGQSGDANTQTYVSKAVALSEQLAKANPSDKTHQLMLARSYILRVDSRSMPFPERIDQLERARSIVETLSQTAVNDVEILRTVAVVNQRLGDQYFRAGETARSQSGTDSSSLFAKAVSHHQNSRTAADGLVALDAENNSYQRFAAIAATNLGEALLEIGDATNAVSEISKAISYFEKNSSTDPANLNAKYELALSQQGMATAQLKKGDIGEASRIYASSAKLLAGVVQQDPQAREYLTATIELHHEAGDQFLARKIFPEALEHYRIARKYLEQYAELPPKMPSRLAAADEKLGDYYSALAEDDKSIALKRSHCREAQTAYQSALDSHPTHPRKAEIEKKLLKCVVN
jgi:eukaryotic-like serine/threonine-protein kinase